MQGPAAAHRPVCIHVRSQRLPLQVEPFGQAVNPLGQAKNPGAMHNPVLLIV